MTFCKATENDKMNIFTITVYHVKKGCQLKTYVLKTDTYKKENDMVITLQFD